MTIRRQIPNGISEDLVVENLQIVEDIFSSKWLAKKSNGQHTIKKLWNRRDYLATIELFTLGNALKLLLNSGAEEWVKGYAERVKKTKASDQVGVSYEAIAASYFMEFHDVQMPPESQPGYDIVINEKKLSFLISCKKLLPSEVPRKVDSKAKEIEKEFIILMKKKRITGLRLLILGAKEGNIPTPNRCMSVVEDMLQTKKREVKTESFTFTLNHIGESDLSQRRISYQFNMLIPQKKTEQKRFENLFGKAYKNLMKHTKEKSSGNFLKMLMVSLPEYISMQKTEKWIRENFKSHYKGLSCVLLTRAIPVQSTSSSFLSLECKPVFNIQAENSLLDKIMNKEFSYFKLQIPIGTVSSEESKQMLKSDDGSMDVSNFYCFQRAVVSYEKHGDSLEVNFNYKPNFYYQVDFITDHNTPPISLAPIFPPEFTTVLL
ncbi:hypothetical protein [Maridesulfovibrio frigidus]|uniref:hypothetical protein n=1 Tax=Maridesulfovibrio frigidus TaxID=340956 RepID=UPI0004E1292E|nr:hypothetical protein [Maridesulfovibrio frigidus]